MSSKQETIDERKANLPLPEQPPAQSDWNSADSSAVNVGSGGQSAGGDVSYGAGSETLRGPATAASAARVDGEELKTNVAGSHAGRTAKEGLGGLPNDAVTREAKDKAGLADTTGKDYGYPQKNDTSSGIKE